MESLTGLNQKCSAFYHHSEHITDKKKHHLLYDNTCYRTKVVGYVPAGQYIGRKKSIDSKKCRQVRYHSDCCNSENIPLTKKNEILFYHVPTGLVN